MTATTEAPPRLHRDGATWLVYLQLSLFAYWLYGFAPSVTLLRDEEHTSDAIAGLHGTTYAAGVVVFGAVAARAITVLGGRGRAMWVFLVALCACIGLYLSSTIPAVTLIGTFLAGLASAGVTTAVAATLIDRHGPAGPAAVTEANAAAAGAGLLAPLAVGGAVGLGWGWRPAILLMLALTGVLFVLRHRFVGAAAGPGRRPATEPTATEPTATQLDAAEPNATQPTAPQLDAAEPAGAVSAGPAPEREAGRAPDASAEVEPDGHGLGRQFWLGWIMVMFTTGVEFSMTVWVAQLLRDRSGVSPGVAATGVTAIVGGMCVGRLFGARIAGRFGVDWLLIRAYALAAAGFTVFWLADSAVIAFAGLALCGLGMALHYPLAMSRAIRAAGPRHADRASAVISLGTGVAAGIAPFLLGFLSDLAPIRYAFLLVPVLLVGAAATLGAARASAAADLAAREPAVSLP